MAAKFAHLHVHSEYSLLDGLGKIPDLVARAKELGFESLALTDHGNMYGVLEFYKECQKQGIKPIIGCEVYVASRSRHDKEARFDQERNHLILLAENNTGYQNLLKLVTKANLEGYYYKPRVDWEILAEHHEGIICSSACLGGQIQQAILQGDMKRAREVTEFYQNTFGKDNFFMEIQNHSLDDEKIVNPVLIKFAKEYDIPLLLTNDVHYVRKEDVEAQDVLVAIQTGKTVDDPTRFSMKDMPTLYMKSAEEMAELFPEHPEAMENTLKVAERCNVEIKLGGDWIWPSFPVPEGHDVDTYLKELTYKGMEWRYGIDSTKEMDELSEDQKVIKARVDYELDVIAKKGYSAYFLIVSDFTVWAKEQGIGVGPGRGSAAGSIVSYCMNITGIDPIYFDLPFERFLNPYRPSPPDIDMDFEDVRRDEVIKYVTDKYGADHVAQIITFGRMESRAAIRDVGRALGFPYADPDRIAKLIPQGTKISKALASVHELKELYQTNPNYKRLIDFALKIEGMVRHSSVHAAGVVIAPKPMYEYTPLQREAKGERITTQFDMHGVEELGLLKMDFLGLRNLTIISNAVKTIKQVRKEDVDLDHLSIENEKAYRMLASGETTGIFQLESSGMRKYIKELKPTNIFDVAAMVALYRPGPMNFIPQYIERKRDASKVVYLDPRMNTILDKSLGLIVYQDDVLAIAIEMAGYDWGEVDKFRKAIGKKIVSEMAAQKEKFFSQIIERGMKPEVVEELWHQIETFAGYGFNKAHAASYGYVAYVTAFLKANYPAEFMCAVLTAESGDAEKVAQAIVECERIDIKVLAPNVNYSGRSFQVEGKDVRFGLVGIKNVGDGPIAAIEKAREDGGIFKSLDDLVFRTRGSSLNKRALESLIKAGALDDFGSRQGMLMVLDAVLEKFSGFKVNQNQGGLFDVLDEPTTTVTATSLPDVEEASLFERAAWEKELMGLYITANPLKKIGQDLDGKVTHTLQAITEDLVGLKVTVGGMVTSLKKIFTKARNDEMAFMTINDGSAEQEIIVFPKVFEQYRQYLVEEAVLVVSGRVDNRDGMEIKILAEEILPIDEVTMSLHTTKTYEPPVQVVQAYGDKLVITVPKNGRADLLKQLKDLIVSHPGDASITLVLPNGSTKPKTMLLPMKVDASTEFVERISSLLGVGNASSAYH